MIKKVLNASLVKLLISIRVVLISKSQRTILLNLIWAKKYNLSRMKVNLKMMKKINKTNFQIFQPMNLHIQTLFKKW